MHRCQHNMAAKVQKKLKNRCSTPYLIQSQTANFMNYFSETTNY